MSAATWSSLFFEHDGFMADKWEQYLRIYDKVIGPFVRAGRPVSLLEIGVQNGGSLQIWRKFLPEGSKIVGLDINPDIAKLSFGQDIEVHVVDATDADAVRCAIGKSKFDIIIDDGSHLNIDIIRTFQILFPLLNYGGVYIIEDLHASYLSDYGGGYLKDTSAIAFLKNIIDGVHCDYFDTSVLGRQDRDMMLSFDRYIEQVSFYNSIAVIEKIVTEKKAPYLRILSGRSADVVPLVRLADAHAARSLAIHLRDAIVPGEQRRAEIDRELLECRARLARLEQLVGVDGTSTQNAGLASESSSNGGSHGG